MSVCLFRGDSRISEDDAYGGKGGGNELALSDGGEHDEHRLHHLLQGAFLRAVPTARGRVQSVYGELMSCESCLLKDTRNCVSDETPA